MDTSFFSLDATKEEKQKQQQRLSFQLHTTAQKKVLVIHNESTTLVCPQSFINFFLFPIKLQALTFSGFVLRRL